MPKKRFKKQTYPPKQFYLYIQEDGSQYLAEGIESFAEISEDSLPVDVTEFTFEIKVLTGSYSINSAKYAADMAIRAQMQGRNMESAASATQELMQQEMIQAIASWSLVDDDEKPVPISLAAVAELQPGWIYTAIEEAYQRVNSLNRHFRR